MTLDPNRPNLYGSSRAALARALEPLLPGPFRARQAFAALYHRDALDPLEWTDFPAPLRGRIQEQFRFERPEIRTRAQAADGTIKATLALPRGGEVEAVALSDGDRNTFCISSQVGCGFGCAFCMTAQLGFQRHLDAGEIVGQVAALIRETAAPRGGFNIVFMGMGEPLNNLEAVLAAIDILMDEQGFALGPRRITISTVGLAPQIEELARRRVPVRLAVSLVTADQRLREQLMPVARRFPLPVLQAAIRRFGAGRRDRPTLEVVMLAGVNDHLHLAAPLAEFAQGARAKVNLIEFNPTPELPYRPAPEERIQHFLKVLARAGVVGTVRRSRGRDAFAACGQLAFLAGEETGSTAD